MPSDRPFIHTDPSSNDTIAEPLRLEMENRSITFYNFSSI
jgi:hypothetical protein